MGKLFVERGPAAALWLIALAAQVSGFTSVAIAFALAGVALFFLLAPAYYHASKWHEARLKAGKPVLGPSHLILVGLVGTWLFVTIGVGAAAWAFWTGHGFAIGSSAIGSRPDDGPMVWYRNLLLEGGPPAGRNVFSLTFRGGNASQSEVELKSANIISAINGTKIDLDVIAQGEIVPINQIELVPPGAPVQLIAKFGAPDPDAPGKVLGLEPKTFLEMWRQFSFNIQDDTKSYRLLFNEGDLSAFFPGMVGPHVSKKVVQK